ncbi:MAG: hypothetical protein HQL56_12170 [Magnetococcales bacterium]|nr:hypothetical protein [Magnetococcales bacterium]
MSEIQAPATLPNFDVPEASPRESRRPAGTLWRGEQMGFADVLDMVNPLQHLPLISSIYQAGSGESIGGAARVVGGAFYGALTGSWMAGLGMAAADTVVQETSGKTLTGHVLGELAPGQQSAKPVEPEFVISGGEPGARKGTPSAKESDGVLRPTAGTQGYGMQIYALNRAKPVAAAVSPAQEGLIQTWGAEPEKVVSQPFSGFKEKE